MNGKLITIFVLLTALILSACGSQPSAETSTPTVDVPTVNVPSTEAPATSTETPEITSTPEQSRPTNAPDCTNSASFVSDVTIPDNSEITGGTTFTKTWRIKNTGTCIWGPDYTLTHYSNQRMGAPDSVPLGITYQDQTLDISMPLTAPTSTGTHRGDFVIKNPEGLIMRIDEDSRLWLIINVRTVATATIAAPAGTTAIPPTTAGSSGSSPTACALTTDSARLTEVLNAINTHRSQSGKSAYTLNSRLAQAAQAHANDIACNQLFGHTGSDGSTVGSRVAGTGYVAAFVTENVYGSNPPFSARDVVNWWINDRTDVRHSMNLVSDTYVEVGVGYAFFNNFGYYVVVFAKP
jgi:uncharacterized protein YkwD